MIPILFLLDAAADPGGVVPWGALIVLLGVVFILAAGFMVGLVFLLIRVKRRKLKQAEMEGSVPG